MCSERMIEIEAVRGAPAEVGQIDPGAAQEVRNEGSRPGNVLPAFRVTRAKDFPLLADVAWPAIPFFSHSIPVALEQMEDPGVVLRHRGTQFETLRTAVVGDAASESFPLSQRQFHEPLAQLCRVGNRRLLLRWSNRRAGRQPQEGKEADRQATRKAQACTSPLTLAGSQPRKSRAAGGA